MDNAESLVKSIVIPHPAFKKGQSVLKKHIEMARERLAWKAAHPKAKANDAPDIVLVTGDAGTGKTFLMDQAAIDLEEFETTDGWIIEGPYSKLPPYPTPITMLERMLWEFHTEEKSRRSEEYLSHRVTTLINECKTVVFFIDEIQTLVDRRTSKVWQHSTDVMKDLSDQTWCLYVLSGLPRLKAATKQNKQFDTRIRARIKLPRFSWNDPESKREFLGCLEGFYAGLHEHAEVPRFYEGEWGFRFYCATGGRMRLVSNLLIELLSAQGKKKKLDLKDFKEAYETFADTDTLPTLSCGPFDENFMKLGKEEVLSAAAKIGSEPEEGEVPQPSENVGVESGSRVRSTKGSQPQSAARYKPGKRTGRKS